jgi:hypothetical protein
MNGSYVRHGRNSRTLLLLVIAPLCLVGACRVWIAQHYPYGMSHSCIKCLGGSLHHYAHDHGGAFPTGVLHRPPYEVNAEILRGKTVPLRVTQKALDESGALGLDSCGWHYVEGLTSSDNSKIAVVWDKVGLDHNGGRLPDGGHEVCFVDGHTTTISALKWQSFLEEQERLLAERQRYGER